GELGWLLINAILASSRLRCGQLTFQLGNALLLGQLMLQLGDAFLGIVLVHRQMVARGNRSWSTTRRDLPLPLQRPDDGPGSHGPTPANPCLATTCQRCLDV